MDNNYMETSWCDLLIYDRIYTLPDGREVKWEEYRKEFAYSKGEDFKLNMVNWGDKCKKP